MRLKIVAGNWKMNKTPGEANQLASEIVGMVSDESTDQVKVILCPPSPYLAQIKALTGKTGISVGGQNCSEHEWGAYTGEVSAAMLAAMEIPYVILGHSERRQYFGETGVLIKRKVDAALANKVIPIFCCGEPLQVREQGAHIKLIKTQVEESLFHLEPDALRKVIVAYEPVWAIGTGKTASAEQAQEMHAVIREQLSSRYGNELAGDVSVLYGGSVKADNAGELFACPDVDGGLVGGASLKSREFTDIIKAAVNG